MPSAAAIRASSIPIAPSPTSPSVRPVSSKIEVSGRHQSGLAAQSPVNCAFQRGVLFVADQTVVVGKEKSAVGFQEVNQESFGAEA